MAGYVGVGMALGAMLRDGSSTTPFWVAGILIFLAAVLIGMTISSKSNTSQNNISEERDSDSSQNSSSSV